MGFGLGKSLILVILAIFGRRFYVLLGGTHDKDLLKNRHFTGFDCSKLLKDTGAEDIDTTSDGIALITTGMYLPPFQPVGSKNAFVDSIIYSADLNVSPVEIREVKINSSKDLMLNAHGLSILEFDGKIQVYMVNHHRDLSTDAVEKFIFDPKKNELNWEKSFTNPSVLRSVNDIVAIGNDQFFATNDHFFQADYPKMRSLELTLLLKLGSVAYCNGDECEIKTHYNYQMPNGITVRTVYDREAKVEKLELLVCFATTDSIGVFEIGEFGDLTFVRSITAPSVTDNPWKAPDGSVYFAGATLGVEAFYKPMGEYHAGSEISILPPDQYELQQVYKDDGSEFSGASIGVIFGENILVGSPIGDLMECHKN